MSVEINKSNYEAFYLDYLEGNLHGEALAAFKAFLADNPDLAIDDTELVSLTAPEEAMDQMEKLAMKRTVAISELSLETVDYFLIARTEGLLSPQEEAQLENWLEANAFYRNDAKLYAMTQLQANPQEVFTNKTALKRKPARIIPMWITGLSVAAGLALIITLAIPNGTEQPAGNNGNQPIAQHATDSVPNNGQATNGTNTVTNPNENGTNRSSSPGDKQPVRHYKQPGSPEQQIKRYPAPDRRNETAAVNPLQKHELRGLENQSNELAQWQAPVITPKQQEPAPSNNDVAWEPVEMRNPIEPVTKTLASRLDTPVDFRTAKASKKKPGGFYLRIGKLEVSHRSASL